MNINIENALKTQGKMPPDVWEQFEKIIQLPDEVFDKMYDTLIATLSDTLYLLLVDDVTSRSCTWSSRKSSAKIISMPSYLITDNIDKMLQDQAQCQAYVTSPYKTIVAKGTRTSASDAAVQTLQSKGYTVSIITE